MLVYSLPFGSSVLTILHQKYKGDRFAFVLL
jgi:hypothetical protein